MLSRTADYLFWMSRYTDRADKRFAFESKHGMHAQHVRGFLPKEGLC